MSNKISIIADTVKYTWKNIPRKKYLNWKKMFKPKSLINTSDFTVKGFPFVLQIEPTNTCNLSCSLCPVGKKELNRKPKNMTLKEFKSIIDNMEDYLLFLILWDWGEPFMHPDLPEMIKYASEKDIRVVTSTNAHFLHNKEYLKKILKSGLSNLIVAIDSFDEKVYKIYRRNGDLNKAFLGLKNLIKLKRELNSKTSINLRTVVMRQNENELTKIKKLAKKLKVDKFTLKTLNPNKGLATINNLLPKNPKYRRYKYKKNTNQPIRIKNTTCYRVWEMSDIFSNGDVVPCCYDYAAELKVGNINEKPFTEIWNSLPYRELRKKIYYNKDSIPKCKACDINFKPSSKYGWCLQSFPLIRQTYRKLLNIRVFGG